MQYVFPGCSFVCINLIQLNTIAGLSRYTNQALRFSGSSCTGVSFLCLLLCRLFWLVSQFPDPSGPYDPDLLFLPVTVVIEFVVRAQRRQGAGADAVGEEDLRGTVYPGSGAQ